MGVWVDPEERSRGIADEMVEQLERVIAGLPDSCAGSRCGVHPTKESPGSHRMLLSVTR